jgi:hypothetical protein
VHDLGQLVTEFVGQLVATREVGAVACPEGHFNPTEASTLTQHSAKIGADGRESSQTWAAAILRESEMAGKLDTQGWIDATRDGRAYAFFLRNEILWVRRNGKYKRTQVSGIDTIAGARALAGSIAGEKEDWVDETRAERAGMPSD